MNHVNITELRRHLQHFLERARSGEEVLVTRHSKVIAYLGPPIDPRAEARQKLEAFRPHASIKDVESPIDLPWNADAPA